mgnify:CR=1 FL=1
MSSQQSTIIYTLTDEAPLLATSAFLPVIRTFAAPAGVNVETSDISVAGRVLGQFPEYLSEDQRVPDHLSELAFSGGRLLFPQAGAAPLPAQAPVRIRIQARDVSLSLQMPEQTSVLNILPATVVDIADDTPGQVLVGLQLGDGEQRVRLLSRISQLSARRLALAPGVPVFAQIKGVAIVR